jgi:hypothetical protein
LKYDEDDAEVFLGMFSRYGRSDFADTARLIDEEVRVSRPVRNQVDNILKTNEDKLHLMADARWSTKPHADRSTTWLARSCAW